MLVLGLGSNVGDPVANLRQTLQALDKRDDIEVVRVSPLYRSDAQVPENAPADWYRDFVNAALLCQTSLTPHQVLTVIKDLEGIIGRQNAPRWAPRVIDIDILVWRDEIVYDDDVTIPHPRLIERPFALWPLLDIWPDWRHPKADVLATSHSWGSRYDGGAPFNTVQLNQRIDGPRLMGIVNVTSDSFSDGGSYDSPQRALDQARQLVKDGAEVIDIGAESTRPKAEPLGADQEWLRLQPALQAICQWRDSLAIKPSISVDTRHGYVARQAMPYEIDMINDVSAGQDPALVEAIADSDVLYTFMHQLGVPPDPHKALPTDSDPVKLVRQWAEKHLNDFVKAGIDQKRLIVDPGIGFSKSYGQSWELLRRAHELRVDNRSLMLGHSRKGFMRHLGVEPAQDRDWESAVIASRLGLLGVDYLRVHNVALHARMFKALAMLGRPH